MLKKLTGILVTAIGITTVLIAPNDQLPTAFVFLLGGLGVLSESAFAERPQAVGLATIIVMVGFGVAAVLASGTFVERLDAQRIPIAVVGGIAAVPLIVATIRRRPPPQPPRYDQRDLRGL